MTVLPGRVQRFILIVAVLFVLVPLTGAAAFADPGTGGVTVGVTVLSKLGVSVTGDSVRVTSNTRWLLETGETGEPDGNRPTIVYAGQAVIVPISEFSTWTLVAH